MQKIIILLLISLYCISCTNETIKGKFELSGEIKNIPDQKIYLEQLYFSEQDPEILDTATIKRGKFNLSGLAPEEGLFRLRMENSKAGFIFINDQPAINFKADINEVSLDGPHLIHLQISC